METIGVVGLGSIGAGVAQCFAAAGLSVIAVEVAASARASLHNRIRQGVRAAALLGRGRPPPIDLLLARITITDDPAVLASADFVVENVPEQWAAKETVYRQLDLVCPPGCLFGANTSCLPIARIAAATGRPQSVIGTHFMIPAPLKDTVEVVRGPATADATLAATLALLARIGKRGIVVGDGPGFVANRVLMLAINEAIATVADGVAAPTDVDDLFVSCFGHRMGPLHTADLIGLDTILYSLEVLDEGFPGGKFRPCPLLQAKVAAGELGRKSGRGFFDYDGGEARR